MKDIIEEWDKIPQEIIDKCIDAFKPKLRCVIKVEVQQIIIINNSNRYTQNVFVKYGLILTNQKKL